MQFLQDSILNDKKSNITEEAFLQYINWTSWSLIYKTFYLNFIVFDKLENVHIDSK